MPVEDTTLWTSQTFKRTGAVSPEVNFSGDPVIGISDEITNTSGLNSAMLTIVIDSLTPDAEVTPNGYGFYAHIEGEVAPAIWVVFATMDRAVNGSNDALINYIELTPEFNIDEGNILTFETGQGEIWRSNHNGVCPGKIRAKLLYKTYDPVKPSLDSITLSAYLRLFDR